MMETVHGSAPGAPDPGSGGGLTLAACAASAPAGSPAVGATAGHATPAAASTSAGWPAPERCPEVAARLVAAKERLPTAPAGAPLAVLALGDPAGLTIEPDMPLPMATSGPPPPAPCVLIVELPSGPPMASRRTLGTDTVLSDYQSGTRERANPAYAQARRDLQETDSGDRPSGGGRLRSTGDVTLDLIGLAATGLIQGVGAFIGGHRSEAAEAKLEATPPTLEEPIYRSYRLTVEDIAAEKTVRARVALVDRRSGEVWEAPRTLTARREMQIAEGLHPQDRGLAEGGAAYRAPGELHQWERAPIVIPLSDLLAWTVAATAASPPGRQGLESLLAGWRSDPSSLLVAAEGRSGPGPGEGATGPEPAAGRAGRPAPSAAASLVGVEGLGGAGGGFYVTAEEILTARSLVGETSLVKVRTAGGLVTYGIVERDDPSLDLVLVHVQKDGPPLPLAADGTALASGDGDGTIGAPILEGGRVVAVLTAAGDGRPVDAAQLRLFLAAGRP